MTVTTAFNSFGYAGGHATYSYDRSSGFVQFMTHEKR